MPASFQARPVPTTKEIDEDLASKHDMPMDNDARIKHEQKWAAWAIKTLTFLKNLLSWEDKVSLNHANLEEMNLSLLIGLLRDLSYYSAANTILASYYDSRLLDPPREVSSLDINSATVELITDSACLFVDYNEKQKCWDKYPKMDFGEDVSAALVGHPKVVHHDHKGGVFKGLNETTKGWLTLNLHQEVCVLVSSFPWATTATPSQLEVPRNLDNPWTCHLCNS